MTTRPRPARRRGPGTAACGAALLLAVSGCSSPLELDSVVERVVAAGPGRDSPAYRTPDPLAAHDLGGTVLALLSGAEDRPAPPGLAVLEAVDAEGRPLQVVTEDAGEDPPRGLGVYAVRGGAGAPPDLVVEVPHPRADLATEDLGQQLFAALDAEVLLVAGAHRTAGGGTADVAHAPASAFAAVDRAVVGPGTVVVQVHGFDESDHPDPAQVVLSSTGSEPGELVERLADALEDADLETCVYDGERCRTLGGTRNVQGGHARAVGATFVHLELAPGLREKGALRDRLVQVLAGTLGP